MINIAYCEAATEVLCILKHTKKELVSKIPRKFIAFLIQVRSKTYRPNFDYTKPFYKLDLKPKTQALLGLIYLKYWADEVGKENFNKKINENECKYQKKLKEKYSIDHLFKSKETFIQLEEKNMQLITIQNKSFIQKVFERIRKLFKEETIKNE